MQESMKGTLIVLLFAVVGFNGGHLLGQTADAWFTDELTGDALLEDYGVFISALQDAHGGLYLYTDSTTFQSMCADAQKSLSYGATRAEAYRILAALVDGIRDGHTWVFPGESDANRLLRTQRFIPFTVTVAGTEMYIDSCFVDGHVLPSGARLVSIDGRPIRSIVAELLPYFTADGHSLSGKLGGLESQFWWYYSLHFGFSERFAVVYSHVGEEQRIELDALTMQVLRSRYAPKRGNEAPVSFSSTNGVAYLRVSTFNGYSLRQYRKHFDEALQAFHAANCSELIVDLRGNGGGREGVENLLISCLGQQCTDKYDAVVIRNPTALTYKHVRHPLRKRMEDVVYRCIEFKRNEAGQWQRRDRFKRSFHAPKHPFLGPTTVLVDRNTFSGAAEFAALVRDQVPRLLVVGEETCGGYQGHVSGYSYEIELPNSGFELHVPRVHFDLNVPGDWSGGVRPHIYLSNRGFALEQLIDEVVYLTRQWEESTASERP